ncbi:MAG: hypothetical protein IJP19_00605 [Clostridia bacterium]|nr:hypothetical protein [Clostridia bacterium]
MRKFKVLRNIFVVLTLVLSHLTCIVVAFNYAGMLCGIEHKGFSAPANTAFYLAIPYYALIIICAVLTYVFNKKGA